MSADGTPHAETAQLSSSRERTNSHFGPSKAVYTLTSAEIFPGTEFAIEGPDEDAMLNVTVSRSPARSLWLVVLFAATALHAHAAVLPLASDPLTEGVPRAGLLTAPMAALAGQWVGRTAAGKVVSLTLRVQQGEVQGDATLDGVAADMKPGRHRLVEPILTGRLMAFSVQSGPCANGMAHGVVRFASNSSAELNLLAGHTPIVVRLSKVG